MRAALLPAGADPFLNAYWLRHYRTWADQVDELHVAVCGPIPPEVIDYHHRVIQDAPNATFHYISKRTDHGHVMTFLLEQTFADVVVFVEDDAFVRQPAVIGEAFDCLERGDVDVIGCPRDAYASEELIAIARARFGDEPQGLAFWPCFLFAKREDLNATDRHFGGKRWAAGEMFLDVRLNDVAVADTFIWASYQLRDLGLKVELREPYRLGGDIGNISSGVPWFHVGSLSSGHGYIWQNPRMTPEKYAEEVAQWSGLPYGETAKRVAWWQRAFDRWDGEIPDYHAEYGEGLQRFRRDFGVVPGEVDYLQRVFDPLITWNEAA